MKKSLKILLCLSSVALISGCANNSSEPTKEEEKPTEVTKAFEVEESVSLNVGETHKIALSGVVGFEASDFTYSSRNDGVATVAADGTITAVDEGETTIIVKAGDLRKQVEVKVVDPNKLEGLVKYSKLKNIAKLSEAQSSVLKEDEIINYAWGANVSSEAVASKFDFENAAEDTAVIGRGATAGESSIWNAGWAVLFQSNGEKNADVASPHAMGYWKMDISRLANSFRLWGWGGNADFSGEGKFRVVAYAAKTEEYKSFDKYVLEPLDIGTLSKDSDGWISYGEIDAASGQITNAPGDNMFVFAVSKEGVYDLRNMKDVIFTVQFEGINNVSNEKADIFGIKRMGFICDDEPDITLNSDAEVSLYPGETSQISVGTAGAAASGVMTYTSSNEDVATVSTEGLITAKTVEEETNVTITISNSNVEGKHLTVAVKVMPVPEDNFTLPEVVNLTKGGTTKLTPTVVSGCVAGFTYESGEKGIFTVANDGTLTGVDAGHATIAVTCGTVTKTTVVNVTTSTLYGKTGTEWESVCGTTNPAGDWDFAWSGHGCADQVDNDGTALTTKPLHVYSDAEEGAFVGEVAPNDFGLITGISGKVSDKAQAALYGVVTVPESGDFRMWGWNPEANDDMLGQGKIRIVAYLPNADWTSFEAYEFTYNTGDNASAVFATNQVTGITMMEQHGQSNFAIFNTPAGVRGKKVVMSVEAYSIANEGNKQTRTYVRRLGWF